MQSLRSERIKYLARFSSTTISLQGRRQADLPRARVSEYPNPDFADHLFWFHWSNGTFMTTLMMQLVLARGSERNPTSLFVADRSQRG
jgi:hypothetical protein